MNQFALYVSKVILFPTKFMKLLVGSILKARNRSYLKKMISLVQG